MKREDYHEITIEDLLKILYEKTGWSFKQLRSGVAELANEEREKRIADDLRAATVDRDNMRREREEEERQEEEERESLKKLQMQRSESIWLMKRSEPGRERRRCNE